MLVLHYYILRLRNLSFVITLVNRQIAFYDILDLAQIYFKMYSLFSGVAIKGILYNII